MVVGVGSYYHLIGGREPNPTSNWALGQLTSATASASYFLEWLLYEFHNQDKPLATVEHLISAPGGVKDRTGQVQAGEEPTMSALEAACKRWSDRAGSNPENIALLYFCGHGISKGRETGLLAADFNDPQFATLTRNAVHVEKTVQGMWSCRADNQCFFIDSCRGTDAVLQETMTSPGRALIDATNNDIRANPQPIYFATGLTQSAHGESNQPSLFTRALVEALNGMAAEDEDGTYQAGRCVVNTERLGPAIRKAMQLSIRRQPWLKGQDCTPDGGGSFPLHFPKGQIKLPLIIGCRPESLHRRACFTIYANTKKIDSRAAGVSDESWETRQIPGKYDIEVQLKDGRNDLKQVLLHPAYKEPTFEFE